MALSTLFTFKGYNPENTLVEVIDVTPPYSTNNTGGYGTPNIARNQVRIVRLEIGNYNDISAQKTVESGGTLTLYRKYLKTKGTAQVYDNKTIVSGDIFIPLVSGLTVALEDEFIDLGYYVPYINPSVFLPTNNTTQLFLDTEELGLVDYAEIPDYIWDVVYEVYGQSIATPFTAEEGVQYIVHGSGTATFNGNTYRVGEVFVGDGSSSVTATANVSALECATEKVYVTTFNLRAQLYELQIKSLGISGDCGGCNVQEEITKVYTLLDTIDYQVFTNAVSFEACKNLLTEASTRLTTLNNCL